MTSIAARVLATIRDLTSRLPTRHHLDEVERQAWNDGYDAACLQMLQGLVDADPDDDADGPLASMVRGLHDRDLDDALAPPPVNYHPDMN